MPSRTRIVLRRKYIDPADGETISTNETAKRNLTSLIAEGIIWKTGLPEGWAKLKMRQKLEYLKTLLPPQWVLEVYTEPRATRPTRSAYKSQFVREGQRKKPRRRTRTTPLGDIGWEPVEVVDPQPPQTTPITVTATGALNYEDVVRRLVNRRP